MPPPEGEHVQNREEIRGQTFESQTFKSQTFESQTFESQTFESQTFERQAFKGWREGRRHGQSASCGQS